MPLPAHFGPDDLWADVETRSRCNLKSAGARRYAADPSTQITTAVWYFRGFWKTACTVHPFLGTHTMGDFYEDIRLCRRFVAHHANFDVNVIRKQNPFIDISLNKIDCTMARAQAVAFPGGLNEVCMSLGIEGKNKEGHALVMLTCKPQRNGTFHEDVDTFRKLLAYNVQDVRCLVAVDEHIPPLTASERVIFERTWRKNEIGLPVDVQLATAIALRRQEIEQESTAKLMELTNNAVTKLSQRQRILEWCNSGNRAAGLESTQKHIVAEALLNEDLHPDVRLVLELLQVEGGSAPLKAQALLDRHVGGFYKDATRYFGARSGRGTSEGVNAFNIARPSGRYDGKEGRPTIDSVIAGLKAGHKYDNIALTDCLRGLICMPEGWIVADNDLSNAELRIALWQAGDAERLDILTQKDGDLYMANAIRCLKLPPNATKNTHPKERQTFKSVTLGGNYALGPKTYMAQQRTAGRRIDLGEATSDIYGYREANPKLFARDGLLAKLDDAFRFAIYEQPGRLFPAGKIAFQKDPHGTIWMLLPSGRAIPHYSAHISHEGDMAFFRGKFGAMRRQKAFGGSLLEISCFAADTEVLTDAGFVRIVDVTAQQRIWDGVEWVRQKGSVCRGYKHVVEVCGTRVTPDHLILCCEQGATQTWRAAGDLSPKLLKSATALATSLLPAGFHVVKAAENAWTYLLSATVARLKKSSVEAISAMQNFLAARFALGRRLRAFGKRVVGATLCPMINSALSYLAPSAALCRVVQIGRTSTTEVMADVEFQSMRSGSRIDARIWNMLSRSQAGTTRPLNSTEKTTTGTTNPATCSFQVEASRQPTAEKFRNSKRCELVYDLLDCGPRNRFAIRTPTGHFLLVHNCQSITRDLITAAEEDIEREMPDVVLLLDVYDSILAAAPAAVAKERSEQVRAIMRRPRSWTAGLPLDCAGYEGQRMSK